MAGAAADSGAPPAADSGDAPPPGLLWVLLTRVDGFFLVVFLIATSYLLVRALSYLHQQLEAARNELRELRSAAQRAQQQPAPDLAAPRAELVALQQQRDDQQRESIALRQRLGDAEARLGQKEEELRNLYALVAEAGCADRSKEDLGSAHAARGEALAAARRSELEAEGLRRHAAELDAELAAAHGRAQQLESTVGDLTARLSAAEEKVAHSQAVWDMMVQQYGLRPAPGAAASGPLGPAPPLSVPTARPQQQWRSGSASPTPSHGDLGLTTLRRPVSPSRDPYAVAPPYPGAPRQGSAYSGRDRSPLGRGSPLPRLAPQAGTGAKWHGAGDDESQTEYLQSLERQIEMLQAHMDAVPRRT
eukprot:TRINITY_DN56227_c0_g1_i1.p2 TRINITY_DN56227_c0_g1~~TRINITY_DN56227_c0_g1_i1.p2  ORF type:complete len:387 (+),score=139.16 TRINITY_DN56227_c0_g1_i1:78-1163(+)